MQYRYCKPCNTEKPLTDFYTGGYYCKECAKAKARERHAKFKDDPTFKRKQKDKELRWRYGITLEQRVSMLEGQGYQCDICFVEIDDRAHTDHDHKTGKVRGILCTNCNRALGHFQEDTDILQAAMDYLERHK